MTSQGNVIADSKDLKGWAPRNEEIPQGQARLGTIWWGEMGETAQMKIQVEAWEMVPYGDISWTTKSSPKGTSKILGYLALG